MIRLVATSRRARAHSDEPITTGSVGMPISVTLSEDFDGLQSVLVCKAGSVSRDLAIMGGELVVPHECLTATDFTLLVGVYAKNPDGTIAIPTVWAEAGNIVQGTAPSEVSPSDPTPSWAAQVQQWAEDAHDTAERLAAEVDGWETAIDAAVQGAENVDAVASKSGTTATITITDRTGTGHTVTVRDGAQGEAGRDGYSPTVEITDSQSAHTVTVTDVDGPHSYTVPTYADEEQARATAESARASAESARATAEAARTTAEHDRQSAESTRSTAEADRVQAESQRASSESQRAAAEASRATAEASRVTAESDRANEWDQLSQDAQEAIDAATEAAESVSDDVDALYNGIDMLRSDIRTAEVEGGIAQTENAVKAVPVDLTVYGNSTQDGTPTPDTPVEIKSVDAPVLTMVGGKNVFDSSLLLKASYTSFDGEYYNTDGYWLDKAFPRASGGFPVPIYGQQAVLSFDGMNKSGTESTQGLNFVFEYTDGTTQSVKVQGLTLAHYSMVSNPSKTLKALIFSYNTNVSAKLKNIQLEYGSEATAYEPYSGVTAPIDLQGHKLRSLPDGTEDRLNLTYDRPSSRKGWAWYKASIEQAVGHVEDMGELTWGYSSDYVMFGPTLANIRPSAAEQVSLMCTGYAGFGNRAINYLANNMPDKHVSLRANYGTLWLRDTDYTDATLFTAAVTGMELDYPLATPTTIQLDDIELPVIPSDHATVYCTGGSAQPTWHMDYQIDADAELVQVHAELDEARTQVAQLFGNQLTGTLSGTIDTAADAYAAPPMALTVDGASTQDGTPTPDAPVPILSVDELALVTAGKNLLQITGTSGSHGGITYTVNADKTIVASGTESSTGYPFDIGTVKVKAGLAYHLSGCPAGGSTGTYRMYPANKPGSWYDTGSEATFTPTADETLTIRIVIGGGTYSNLVFKPQLELGSTATEFKKYSGTTVPLYDGTLRSLPDGTKDELNLSYLRPSTREGWAWYGREVTVYTVEQVYTAVSRVVGSGASRGFNELRPTGTPYNGSGVTTGTRQWSNRFGSSYGTDDNTNRFFIFGTDIHFRLSQASMEEIAPSGYTADGLSEFNAWLAEHPIQVVAKLATPVTTALDPIELPQLPAPACTVWCDGGSAQPTYTMEYVRDSNLVIQQLEAALADLATS